MRIQGHFFDVRLDGLKNNKKPGFFVVVGSRVSKKAVERNLIKRRIRAILREISTAPPGRITIISKSESVKAKFTELKKEIQFILGKL